MEARPAVFRSGEAWRWVLRWWSAEKSRAGGSYRWGRSSSAVAHPTAALISGGALLACPIVDVMCGQRQARTGLDLGPMSCGHCVSLDAVWCSQQGRPDRPEMGPVAL
jgi:hypothetical protein